MMRDFDLSKITGNEPPLVTDDDKDATIAALTAQLAEVRRVCDEQANDEGLWFMAVTVTEDYLQSALRRLHAAVEGTASQPPTCTCDGEYKLDADCPAHGDPSFANVDQPSPVAYGCTGCQSAPCVCNDVLRNALAEVEAELAFARSSGDESAIEYRALREQNERLRRKCDYYHNAYLRLRGRVGGNAASQPSAARSKSFWRGVLYGWMYPWRVARFWYLERYRHYHEYVDCPHNGCPRCFR